MQDVRDLLTGPVPEVLNCLNAGVYIVDLNKTIVFWNRRAEEVTGHKAEDVVGEKCRNEVLAHRDKDGRSLCETELCPLHRAMALNQSSEDPLLVYAKTSSGDRIPLSTSVAPIHDREGNVIGGVEVFRDETQNMLQMKLAREVHEEMLTTKMPTDDRISFDLQYVPVELVGGDFFRIVKASDDVFSIFLADVAGHGTAAALYIALMHSLAEECEEYLAKPGEFLSVVNERVYRRVPKVGFVTGISATVNANTGEVVYSSAGHPPAIHQKKDNRSIDSIKCINLPMGAEEHTKYDEVRFEMRTDDRLLFYTDGVTELRTTGASQMLGTRGLKEILKTLPVKNSEHRLDLLYSKLIQKCASHVPEDDLTIISCLKQN
jgi:PAS domain S-box-containing protein